MSDKVLGEVPTWVGRPYSQRQFLITDPDEARRLTRQGRDIQPVVIGGRRYWLVKTGHHGFSRQEAC